MGKYASLVSATSLLKALELAIFFSCYWASAFAVLSAWNILLFFVTNGMSLKVTFLKRSSISP